MFLVYVACKNKKEAKKIARDLLEQNLIGCANMWPIESMYKWKGNFVEDCEYTLLLKTKKNNYKSVETRVLKNHSSDTPAIFGWSVNKANKKYLLWLKGQC